MVSDTMRVAGSAMRAIRRSGLSLPTSIPRIEAISLDTVINFRQSVGQLVRPTFQYGPSRTGMEPTRNGSPGGIFGVPLEAVEARRLYRQVADQLRALIDGGEYAIGSRLPTERD